MKLCTLLVSPFNKPDMSSNLQLNDNTENKNYYISTYKEPHYSATHSYLVDMVHISFHCPKNGTRNTNQNQLCPNKTQRTRASRCASGIQFKLHEACVLTILQQELIEHTNSRSRMLPHRTVVPRPRTSGSLKA